MQPALVGERAAPDIWLMWVWRSVADLVDEMRNRRKRLQLAGWKAFNPKLKLKIGSDRNQVGVTAPLTDSVDGPLNMCRSGCYCS